MILLIIAIIAIIIGISFTDTNNSSQIIDEYCNLECQERKTKKYNFCC